MYGNKMWYPITFKVCSTVEAEDKEALRRAKAHDSRKKGSFMLAGTKRNMNKLVSEIKCCK